MSRKGYISVNDAAKLLGISRQSVHNRRKAGRYRAEEILTGKQKHYELLEEDVLKDVEEPSSEYQLDTKSESLDSPEVADLSRYLWGTLELVEKQLTGRDQIIATLTQQLETKDQTITRLQEAVTKLAESQAQAQAQAREHGSWWQRLWR